MTDHEGREGLEVYLHTLFNFCTGWGCAVNATPPTAHTKQFQLFHDSGRWHLRCD